MYVHFMQWLITTILALYGLTPLWCDSCGESYLDTEMTTCDVCGATICPICDELYEGIGCYVCDGNAANIGIVECESCGKSCPDYDVKRCPMCNSNVCSDCDTRYMECYVYGYVPGCYVCNKNIQQYNTEH